MNFDDLKYFITIADTKSFSKAAVKLFISQSALSQAIKKLETITGKPLFIREINNIRLTSSGVIFYEYAHKILSLKTQMLYTFDTKSDIETLRLGISPFYSKYYLPKIIPVINQVYPQLKIEITEEKSSVLEDLTLDSKLDMCMLPLPLDSDDLEYKVLLKETIYIAVPQNHFITQIYSKNDAVDINILKDEDFIFLKSSQRFYKMGMDICADAKFKPKIVFDSMNWETVDMMIGTGMGVGFVPSAVVMVSHLDKPLYYNIKSDNISRDYVVAYLSSVSHDIKNNIDQFIYCAEIALSKLDMEYEI